MVTVSGARRAVIENHRGIINFDDTLISARLETGKLSVAGTSLTVKAMADTKIVIEGKINSIEFE